MSLLKVIDTIKKINHQTLQVYNNLSATIQKRTNKAVVFYENYFGIRDLKDIQLKVINAEKVFTDASKARREAQACILKLQDDLKNLRRKLDSTNRTHENYLNLLTEEHKLIKEEFRLTELLRHSEEDEREKFTFFSNRLRESQDFEKIRQEKLKYISLIGSVIGALLGIIATSINYSLRQRDLSNLTESLERQVNQDKEINFYANELKKIIDILKAKDLPGNNEQNYTLEACESIKLQLEKLNEKIENHLEPSISENNLQILVFLTVLGVLSYLWVR